jgi:hypothetical protein
MDFLFLYLLILCEIIIKNLVDGHNKQEEGGLFIEARMLEKVNLQCNPINRMRRCA